MNLRKLINLILIGLSNLFGAITLSILSPFYPGEALKKQVTVTQSGIVLGSVFFTTVICTPIIGRYIDLLGARRFLLLGSIISALGNIVFGFLDNVYNSTAFFVLSIIIRIVVALGEAAVPIACMTLATKQVEACNRGKAVAICEASFGVGTMFGASVGGLLYEAGGFSFPFFVAGGIQAIIAIISAIFMSEGDKVEYESRVEEELVEATWCRILGAPGVLVSCFALCLCGTAWAWYSASLEPFLSDTYNINSSTTGLVFMTLGISYTIFTPIFGYLSDHGLHGLPALVIGNFIITVGFCLLNPIAPIRCLFGSNVWMTITSITLQGIGSAATYLGALMCMLKGVSEVGLPDTEKVRGMVSSLWVVADCSGCYIGSTLGSWTYDHFGFEGASLAEIAALGTTVVLLAVCWGLQVFGKRSGGAEGELEERTPLIVNDVEKQPKVYGANCNVAILRRPEENDT